MTNKKRPTAICYETERSAVPLIFTRRSRAHFLRRRHKAGKLLCFNAAIRTRLLGNLWGVNSEGIPLKKYQLRSSTNRALSVSLPFSEFFVNVFSTLDSISQVFFFVKSFFQRSKKASPKKRKKDRHLQKRLVPIPCFEDV